MRLLHNTSSLFYKVFKVKHFPHIFSNGGKKNPNSADGRASSKVERLFGEDECGEWGMANQLEFGVIIGFQ